MSTVYTASRRIGIGHASLTAPKLRLGAVADGAWRTRARSPRRSRHRRRRCVAVRVAVATGERRRRCVRRGHERALAVRAVAAVGAPGPCRPQRRRGTSPAGDRGGRPGPRRHRLRRSTLRRVRTRVDGAAHVHGSRAPIADGRRQPFRWPRRPPSASRPPRRQHRRPGELGGHRRWRAVVGAASHRRSRSAAARRRSVSGRRARPRRPARADGFHGRRFLAATAWR